MKNYIIGIDTGGTYTDAVLLVIGYAKHFRLPVKAVIFIKGGHTITGAEEEPLDLEYLVIEYIFNRFWGKTLTNFISTRNSHPVLQVGFSLRIPLIGIGAAARFFLPGVAARLSTTVTFPENYAVGNAIGAAMICKKAFIMKEAQ